MNDLQPILVRRKSAAQLIGIELRTFDRLNSGGLLGPRPSKLGGSLLWSVEELADWARHAGNGGLPNRQTWQEMRKRGG